MQNKENKDGFILPLCVENIKYTDVMDLRMASNYQHFCNSGFQKHLNEISEAVQDFYVFDMTGNIGCDAINFATVLKDTKIFTCELNEDKAQCLKENCSSFKNIFVFSGDSNELIRHIFNSNISKIKSMCISKNKTSLGRLDFSKKWLINIDPPFGSTYDKNNEICNLEFCGKDVLEYFNEIKHYDNIVEYIIKSPTNWNYIKKNDINKSSIYYVKTKKSAFIYNTIKPFDIQFLFNDYSNETSEFNQVEDLEKLEKAMIKNFKLKKFTNTLTNPEFNELITKMFCENVNINKKLLDFYFGIGEYETIDKNKFYPMPCFDNKNFNVFVVYCNVASCIISEYNLSERLKYLIAFKLINIAKIYSVNLKEFFDPNILTSYDNQLSKINMKTFIKDIKKIQETLGEVDEMIFYNIDNLTKDLIKTYLSKINYVLYSHNHVITLFKNKYVKFVS